MVKRLDVSYTKLGIWFFCYRLWPANIYRSYFSKAILLMYFILVCTCLGFLIKFFMILIKLSDHQLQFGTAKATWGLHMCIWMFSKYYKFWPFQMDYVTHFFKSYIDKFSTISCARE